MSNFKILSQVVAEKSLTEKNGHNVLYMSDRRKKWKIQKKRAKSGLASLFSFTQYTLPTWRCTQNLKTLAPTGAEKSVTEISIGEKEKWNNKGTDKQYMAVFVTQYNSSLSSFVPNFRILIQVVAEKSLTEKSLHKQTDKHNYRKGKNYIPPIYFLLGGIITTSFSLRYIPICASILLIISIMHGF